MSNLNKRPDDCHEMRLTVSVDLYRPGDADRIKKLVESAVQEIYSSNQFAIWAWDVNDNNEVSTCHKV